MGNFVFTGLNNTAGNSTYNKLAAQWLNEALWFNKHSFFV